MDQEGFDSRTKMKVFRSMIPDYKRYLVPSKIIPDLTPQVLNEDQMRNILEKENQSRPEAVQMMMDAVIAMQEDGLSYFIHALKQGNKNYYRFLNPLGETPAEEDRNHEEVNKYFKFLIQCLEGDIIRSLTEQEFNDVARSLVSQGVIDDMDLRDLQALMPGKRGVLLFRMMPQTTQEWPLKFFRALNKAKPEIVPKCDPQGECPFEEVDKEAAALSGSEQGRPASGETLPKVPHTASEETPPKQPHIDEEASGQTSMDIEEDFMDVEDDLLASDEDIRGFSDEEEKEDADTEKTNEPKSLSLRKYQYELATPSLRGDNNIICAPTGSGKTRVALHIVKEHLMSGRTEDRKVVFMARTVPLVSQQFKIFEKYLQGSGIRCGMVHGETADHEALHLMLDDFDILVMTPKILENHLIQKKISSLSVFSLIIFDECHHTRKEEPYNCVMKSYLQFKKDGERNLPQIVGLTASIGVEKASTIENAEQSIIDIMANLDVNSITKVRDKENLEELSMTVPTPDEELVNLTPRADDEISMSILDNMMQVERLLAKLIPARLDDPEFCSIKILLGKRPAERNSQKYGQWAVKLCDQARKIHIPEQPNYQLSAEMIESRRLFSQNVQLLAETLIAYNEALDVHELTRPEDVLVHLRNKLDPRHAANSPAPTHLETELLKFFEGLRRKLQAATGRNPNLTALSEVITRRMQGQWDSSRVMIFVRTRATCEALSSWLNTDDSLPPELQEFGASPFTGAGAHQEHGGMTQHQQEGVMEKFREGDVKLLVCTTVGQEGMDIPDCNLVIRYNQVGNEVATVQTRGRSRKAGGVSVLLAMPEVIRKERINKKRVEIMNKAIDNVNRMRGREVTNKVLKAQKQAMDKDEMKKIASMRNKSSRKRKGSFTLACARCRKVCVPGSSIRTINESHHVLIGNDLVDRQEVSIKFKDKPKQVDDKQFTGEIICNKCPVTKQNVLGTVMKSQEVEYLTLKAQGWLVQNEAKEVVKCGKWKWSDIGYAIPELTPRDMSLHLGLPQEDEEEEEEEGAVGGAY